MRFFKIVFCVSVIAGISLGWFMRSGWSDKEPQKTKVLYFSPDYVLDPTLTTNSDSDISFRLEPPVSYDSFLSYSFRMSEMSKELSGIYRDLLNKDIKLSSSNDSYKGQKYMVAITEDVIYVHVYSDMANILTRNEILAYATHELAHIFLGHYQNYNPGVTERDVALEIAADIWSVRKGIDPVNLISALMKLSSLEDERNARINILNAFLTE